MKSSPVFSKSKFAALTTFSMILSGIHPADAAQEWDQFRGPKHNGMADASNLPAAPAEGTGVRWKTEIHGKGWSSPLISGDKVWLTTATEDGTELSVVVLDRATGKILRDEVLFKVQNPQFCHKFNSYASPTPVISAGRVYVSFGSPGTACLDEKTGAKVWERTDFVCNHFRGSGSSPIVWGGMLIMNFDGSDFQYVVALDGKTGQTVWRTERSVDFKDLDAQGKPTGDGDFRKAFATPEVVELNGVPVLISSGAKCHYLYDAKTGKELWRFEERAHHSASSRPLVWNGNVLIQSGIKGHLLCIPLASEGVVDESRVLWRAKKGIPGKPSLLLVNDMIFMVDDSGIATCMDPKTGEAIWTERVGGNFSASPIYADGRIYVCNEEGKVTSFAAAREYKVLGEGQFDSGFMASPAAVGNALYLRSKTHMYCLQK
jgi:outer membrane protein assembly factor BamB